MHAKHVAVKTANKNLLRIHLHTFRDFHRSITSTTVYENSDVNAEVEQYTIKAVASKEEAIKLGELGYEPFDEIDGVRLYRKRCIGLD